MPGGSPDFVQEDDGILDGDEEAHSVDIPLPSFVLWAIQVSISLSCHAFHEP